MNGQTKPNGHAANGASDGNHQSNTAVNEVQHLRKALATGALEQLRGLRRTLPVLAQGQNDLREDLLQEIRQMMLDLETPWHTLQRTLWRNVSRQDSSWKTWTDMISHGRM